jgi:hypothetical protein
MTSEAERWHMGHRYVQVTLASSPDSWRFASEGWVMGRE